ncbi:MAG: DUF1080 domain-containing protein [Cyclobacteriaceae bacterium]|nr:DUF1080 domain-containing protein [Cyclobacteriaceae bacterium]
MKKRLLLIALALPLMLAATFVNKEKTNDGWVDLFNGKDFKGWKKRGGEAEYKIEGDAIVGYTKLGTPNTFLCTEKNYTDFIFEVEFMVNPLLNSGIQIRSNSLKEYRDGRVHGYQIEIDPSPRAFSGGIYDEARRGWLNPLTRNEEGRKAFKVGGWNKYRVEAIGNTIRTWVNGVQCANLVDDMTAEGFIALQVHGVGKDTEKDGITVKWKNIRIKTENLEEERWTPDPTVEEWNYVANTLTEWEKKKGWKMLWDGKTADGWRSVKGDKFPEKGWEMKDGVLTVLESGGGEAAHGGDIITKDTYSSFDLKIEFKITEGANSGIKYFVDPELNKGSGSAIGLEYQVLDDKVHPDASKGVSGNRQLAGLYDLIAPTNLSVPGRKKNFRGIGEWNQARIIVRGNHIEHWLNGDKVVEYERNTQMYRALVAYSKYSKWPHFGESKAGHILLQDHGNTVSFRSIKIREL